MESTSPILKLVEDLDLLDITPSWATVDRLPTTDLALSEDDALLFAVYSGFHAALWDLSTKKHADFREGNIEKKPKKGEEVMAGALAPGGVQIITGTSAGVLCFWDTFSNTITYRFKLSASITGVASTCDGRYVLAVDGKGLLAAFELERPYLNDPGAPLRKQFAVTGVRQLYAVNYPGGSIYSVAVTPDGKTAITGGKDGNVVTWDAKTGNALQAMQGHTAWVYRVVALPDGRRAASVSYDKSLKIWDISKGELMSTIETHSGERNDCVAVTPDMRYAALGDEGEFFNIWNMETGQKVTLGRALAGVTAFAFNHTGTRLYAGQYFTRIRSWDFNPP